MKTKYIIPIMVLLMLMLSTTTAIAGTWVGTRWGQDGSSGRSMDLLNDGSFNVFSGNTISLEWQYNTSITGYITDVYLRAGSWGTTGEWGDDCKLSDYPEWFYLYINGESAGVGDEWFRETNYSNFTTMAALPTVDIGSHGWTLHWANCDVYVDNDDVVFEMYKPSGVGSGTNPTNLFIPFCTNGSAYEMAGHNDPIDTDGDGGIGPTKMNSNPPNGIFDGTTKKYSAENNYGGGTGGDPVYMFYYSETGEGGSGYVESAYGDELFVDPTELSNKSMVTIDYFFNQTSYLNYLMISGPSGQIVNESIETSIGTRMFFPRETGTYYVDCGFIDGSNNWNYTSNVSINVLSGNSNFYIYVEEYSNQALPVYTGQNAKIIAKNTQFTDWNSVVRIYSIDDEGNDDVLKSETYIVNTAESSFTWKPPKEGVYHILLQLDKNVSEDVTISDCYLYVKDEDYVQSIRSENITFCNGENTPIYYTNNLFGSKHVQLKIYPATHTVLRQEYFYENIQWFPQGVAYWTPEKYNEVHSISFVYDGLKIYQYNVSVDECVEVHAGPEQVITDFDGLWSDAAYYLGFDDTMFRVIMGVIICMVCMMIPVMYFFAKSKGSPYALASGFQVLGNPMYLLGFWVLGSFLAYALSLWPIWIFVFAVIVIVILGAYKGKAEAV